MHQFRDPRAGLFRYIQNQQQACVSSEWLYAHNVLTYLAATYPSPNKTDLVKPILKTLEIDNLKAGLKAFTTFRTRCTPHHLLSSPN